MAERRWSSRSRTRTVSCHSLSCVHTLTSHTAIFHSADTCLLVHCAHQARAACAIAKHQFTLSRTVAYLKWACHWDLFGVCCSVCLVHRCFLSYATYNLEICWKSPLIICYLQFNKLASKTEWSLVITHVKSCWWTVRPQIELRLTTQMRTHDDCHTRLATIQHVSFRTFKWSWRWFKVGGGGV